MDVKVIVWYVVNKKLTLLDTHSSLGTIGDKKIANDTLMIS